jgi:hypothetical protein
MELIFDAIDRRIGRRPEPSARKRAEDTAAAAVEARAEAVDAANRRLRRARRRPAS